MPSLNWNPEIAEAIEIVADGIVEAYPDADLDTLIARLGSDAVDDGDDDDPDVDAVIIAELRKRVAAGVRIWTDDP